MLSLLFIHHLSAQETGPSSLNLSVALDSSSSAQSLEVSKEQEPVGESAEEVLNSVQKLLDKPPESKQDTKTSSPIQTSKNQGNEVKKKFHKTPNSLNKERDKPSTLLSLKECWERALAGNSKILIARENLERALGVVVQAKSTLYPQVGSNARVYTENKDVFDQRENADEAGFREKWTATLFVQQSIYSGGVNRHNIAIAKLEQEIEFIRLQETINSVLFEVSSAFYEVLVSRSDVETRELTVDLLRKEVKRQKGLFEAGRVTKFQVLRAEVRLANEIPGLIEAENRVRTSTMSLVELLGKSSLDQLDDRQVEVRGQLNCPPLNEELEQLIAHAIERSPTVSEQIKKIEVARRQASIARASILPRINLFAGVTAKHEDEDETLHGFLDHHLEAAAGIMGSWNFFDGFEGKGKAMQAEAQAEMAEIASQEMIRSIEFNVRRAYLDLKQAQNAVRAQEGNVKKALESIELAESSADAGFGTQFEVLEAKVDLATARNVELRARRQYHLALAILDRLLYRRIEEIKSQEPTFEHVKEKSAQRSKEKNSSSS